MNNFLAMRSSVASRLSVEKREFIEAQEFYTRKLLWQRGTEVNSIAEWDQHNSDMATLQALAEMVDMVAGAEKLALCGVIGDEKISRDLRTGWPDLCVEIWGEEDIAKTEKRDGVVAVAGNHAIRDRLVACGMAPGLVVVWRDVSDCFRILPNTG